MPYFIRHAQAALGADLLAGRFDDDGLMSSIIYSSFSSGTFVSSTMTARRSTPTCGAAEATPVGLRQRLAHIVEQRVQTGIEILDLVAVLAQLGSPFFRIILVAIVYLSLVQRVVIGKDGDIAE